MLRRSPVVAAIWRNVTPVRLISNTRVSTFHVELCRRRQCRQRVHLGARRHLFLSFKFGTAARRSAWLSTPHMRFLSLAVGRPVTYPSATSACRYTAPSGTDNFTVKREESQTFETMAENQLQRQRSADWTCTRRRVGIRKSVT